MKNDEIKKAIQKSHTTLQEAHPQARAQFKALLLSNPNYFGNLESSPFVPVLAVCGNTHYEEIVCLGYHPQQEQLEAVVYVYQPSGYGTGVCGVGTPEYVRFYLSFDNGATWQDQGMTSFQTHNIPEGTEGGKRLEYAASLKVDPKRKWCKTEQVILARAVLSWNNPPPANLPNWCPIWGNRHDAKILVEPIRFIRPPHLFDLVAIKTPLIDLDDLVDIPIPLKQKALTPVELACLYRGKGVPAHRFAFKEISNFFSANTLLSPEAFSKMLPAIEWNPGMIDALFPKTDGDTSYEELKCIGLDPDLPDTLVGVMKIKKSSGYSGGPCTQGSIEYVTFWGDFDGNGTFETCLGTASVRVYDLAVPPEGLDFAVRLPVNLEPHRQHCKRGPKVVRIRAILSWNVAVPCATPNAVPTWGNREETLIEIAPLKALSGRIAILGGIPVSHIHDVTGLTTPTAVFATNNLPPDSLGRTCPFAGRVTVQGSPVAGHRYKVEVTPAGGGAPVDVVTNLTLTRADGTTHVHTANMDGQFGYLPFDQNVNSVLAQWDTTGDALWNVTLSVFTLGGVLVGSDMHVIQLDNTGPEASITITSGAGDCGKFQIGDVLSGKFTARDTYFGSYSLGVEPDVNDPGEGVPVPSSGDVQTAPAPGNSWSLNTAGMRPCGYVIRVVAVDRAIVGSQAVGHHASDSAGFCLEEVKQ